LVRAFQNQVRLLGKKLYDWCRSQIKRTLAYIRSFPQRSVSYLDRHDLVWRRIRFHLVGFVGILSLLVLLLFGLGHSSQITSFTNYITLGGVDYLVNLGTSLGFDGQTFADYVSADILADLVSAVIIFVVGALLAWFWYGKFRQGGFPTHDITVIGEKETHTESNGEITYYVKVSNEEGDESAQGCTARITLTGLTRHDIVDVPEAIYSSQSDKFRSTNYFKRTDLSFKIPWEHGAHWVDILSGDSALLPVMKFIPARPGVPEHFEVSCLTETTAQGNLSQTVAVGVCLRPLHQFGKIRIIPSKGRFREEQFSMTRLGKRNWRVKV